MSRIKKLIIGVLFIITILVIYILSRHSNRFIYNDNNAFGNTPGNLFNNGLFCELNDNIYFSNRNDDGTLYQMDSNMNNFRKLSDDKVEFINAVGNYIYYVRKNYLKDKSANGVLNSNDKGVYRINLNGKNIKLLYDEPSGMVNVHGNNVYYQHYNKEEGISFYSIGIDGKNEKKISNISIMPISIINHSLYYTLLESDHYIHKMNLDTKADSILYKGNCNAPIICGEYLYYMSLDNNYEIYRVSLEGNDPTPIVQNRVSTFNITSDGRYIYYQVDDNENNGIYRMNLQSGESTLIREGNYKQIHIVGKYVFFTDFNDTNTYYMTIGNSNGVTIFNPPKLKK